MIGWPGRAVLIVLLIAVTPGAFAAGLGESGPGDTAPGIRLVGEEGSYTWALEEPQPGEEVMIVGRLATYGNEPFATISIDTFLDPEGVRGRRRYEFSPDGLTPPELDDPTPPGLVRVRGAIERVPGPGRSGVVHARSIERVAD